MIKDNQRRLNRFHVVLDAVVITVSYVLAWFLWIGSGWRVDPGQALSITWYMGALIFVIPVNLFLYGVFHLYTPKRIQGRRIEFANICKANIMGLLIVTLVLYMLSKNQFLYNFSRWMILLFFGINVLLEITERNLIRIFLRSLRTKGYNQKHILLIGYSRAAESFIDRVRVNSEWGYQIHGILDNRHTAPYKGIEVVGRIDTLEEILEQNTLDEIAITLSIAEYKDLERIVSACEKSGVHTKFIPDYNNMIPTRPYTEDLMGLPVINIRHVPLNDMLNSTVKRIVDVIGAVVAVLLFSPIMLLVAIVIKCTSRGPIIYSQERVGLHNRPFKMYKFRSMEVQVPAKEKSQWTTPNDPRITPIGQIIRKTSIDETPQFFNVLMGSMSLVGPRPERPFFVERFREEIPRYMIKHQVRPGLTGWAQVNGYRGDTSITKRIEHDLYYIENWTFGFDIKILFLTVFKGFINKNAY